MVLTTDIDTSMSNAYSICSLQFGCPSLFHCVSLKPNAGYTCTKPINRNSLRVCMYLPIPCHGNLDLGFAAAHGDVKGKI